MKESLLEFLACPACRSGLALKGERVSEGEIMEGTLTCSGCEAGYPVARGVPRFVSSGAYADSFGFQWNAFPSVQLDSSNGGVESARSFESNTGMTAQDLRGRLVLDAGVGAGRYADVVSRWGGEVVGVDITRAVDAAFTSIGHRPGVHIVQADIFAMPFADEVFDVAYSIGVLHHTPDPARAFQCVARRVKAGGTMAVYVYAAMGVSRHFSDAWRKVTTKLPQRLMFYAAAAAVPLYYLYQAPMIGRIFQTVAPISMHRKWQWRWLDTFDWYTPQFQFKSSYPEVWRWFDQAGFHSIRVLDEPICMRGRKRQRGAGGHGGHSLGAVIDTSAS